VIGFFHSDETRRGTAYRRFWSDVGESFPDLGGATSTDYYRANEERLLREHIGCLRGKRILKTDLWDEAKNTRILFWAAHQGADVHGVDISAPIARLASDGAPTHSGRFLVADCRCLPYRDATFDVVYSMGTIEHFDESDAAVREMFRVLKRGGKAVIGVPNRLDPFLRPVLVMGLSVLGLYGFGFEKSYTRRSLRDLVTASGFTVVAESAILFIPGWIRMLDLACHAWAPLLATLTAALVRPFVWLDAHLPAVRRHGYLIVAVGLKK
jgi:SAM-dependent methyltransferase